MTSDDRATSTTDDHFGSCPECGQASVYVNIGRVHWFYCDEHRVKWCVGANLFSSWRYQGPAQWEENHRKLQGYREMLPASTDRRGGLPLRNAQADRKPPALFRDTTMNLFRWIRSLTGPPRPGEPVDRESSSVMPLRLVSRHRFGGLVIGHYLTNPGECPDHVFRHDCRFQTFTQGDFETTRWTVGGRLVDLPAVSGADAVRGQARDLPPFPQRPVARGSQTLEAADDGFGDASSG